MLESQEKVIAERESALLKEQELYNCLRNKDYGPAIKLALELKRPQRLWGVLRDAMTEGMGENVPGSTDEGECVTTGGPRCEAAFRHEEHEYQKRSLRFRP